MVNLVKIIGLGLAGVTAILFLREAASKGLGVTAQQSGIGFGTLGASLGSTLGGIGSGIGQLGAGVGSGAASLLNPLFTLRDLVYGPQAGQQAAPTAATQGVLPKEQPPTQRQPEKQIKLNNLMDVSSFKIEDGFATIRNQFGTLRGPAYGGFPTQQAQSSALTSGILAGASNPTTSKFFNTPFYRSLGVRV